MYSLASSRVLPFNIPIVTPPARLHPRHTASMIPLPPPHTIVAPCRPSSSPAFSARKSACWVVLCRCPPIMPMIGLVDIFISYVLLPCPDLIHLLEIEGG